MNLKRFTRWSRLHQNFLANSALFIFLSLCILIEKSWTLPSGESGENDSQHHRIQNFTRGHNQQRRKRANPDDFLGRISSERIIAIGDDPGSESQSDETCCVLSVTEENKCDAQCDAPQTQVCTCDFHFQTATCSWECLDDPPDPPDPDENSEEARRKKRSPHIRHHSKSRMRHNKHHHRSGSKHH